MTTDLIIHPLIESVKITTIVFLMMLGIDLFNVKIKGKIHNITGGVGIKQYIITNILGVMPGCFGSFMNVSLYVHGTISFGAVTGSMISTSGDEAFVMIAQLGWKSFYIFGVLFILGIVGSYIADYIVKKFNITVCVNCELQAYHQPHEHERGHYLKDHIWNHIIKKHILSIFLWTFGALLIVHIIQHYLNLDQIVESYMLYILVIAALIGLLPESGPHLIFISLYATGLIPFSVLLTSSIVQDGHGLLPMVSFSFKDATYIKIFNFIFGLVVGLIIYSIGF